MKLVIGGAYQGKLAYAQKNFPANGIWIDGSACPVEAIYECGGIYRFHEYVKRMIEQEHPESLVTLEQQAAQFVQLLQQKNPEIVIVSNELGCGVVPMEKKDRMWREAVGRICTCVAERSERVDRVICGVGVRLK